MSRSEQKTSSQEESMSRDEYIEARFDRHLYYWSSVGIAGGCIIISVLSILDYVVSPENWPYFLYLRLSTAALFLVWLALNLIRVNRRWQTLWTGMAGLTAAVMIALLIQPFGGHESVYFAGFIILFIFVTGIVTFSMKASIFLTILYYCIYLVPILIYDDITNISFFIAANGLMLSCIFALLTLRFLGNRSVRREFGLRYDLDQEHSKLEAYSAGLEQLVDKRTRDLNRSELMLRSLFDNANVGVIITDANGVIEDVNKEATALFGAGCSELIDTDIDSLFTSESRQQAGEQMEKILSGEAVTYEAGMNRNDGSTFMAEVSAKAIEAEDRVIVQSFIADITEKSRLQEQLTQAQKLEAIGRLAGGIAHDFNNLLTTIIGYCDLLLLSMPEDDPAREDIRIIAETGEKAAVLTRQLLTFSSMQIMEMKVINLNRVVGNISKMISRLIGEDIILELDIYKPVRNIYADQGQVEQIIMNLAINARDAMPSGGKLTIRTEDLELEQEDARLYEGLMPGAYVGLSISDTGTGMTREVMERIFEPFYTTKGLSEGTGLGLSVVHGIITQHDSHITVESELGKGTAFHIYFPAVSEVEEVMVEEEVDYEALRGDETILVVDDEPSVRSAVSRKLEQLGYNVLEASSGEDAIALFEHDKVGIDLLLSDVIMPGMNGRELAETVRGKWPGTRIVLMSGYTDDIIAPSGALEPGILLLYKPISPKELAKKLREALG